MTSAALNTVSDTDSSSAGFAEALHGPLPDPSGAYAHAFWVLVSNCATHGDFVHGLLLRSRGFAFCRSGVHLYLPVTVHICALFATRRYRHFCHRNHNLASQKEGPGDASGADIPLSRHRSPGGTIPVALLSKRDKRRPSSAGFLHGNPSTTLNSANIAPSLSRVVVIRCKSAQ